MLVAAEAGIRLFGGDSLHAKRAELENRREAASRELEAGQSFFRWHPHYCYTLAPNWEGVQTFSHPTRLATDGRGFRNGGLDYTTVPKDEWVIGLFGGSLAFGDGIMGNENTVSAQTERFLREKTGQAVHVVNFAMPAWQYPQQLIAVERMLDGLDAVVTLDGFNELIVPYWNWWENPGERLETDFPPHFSYHLFADALSLRRAAILPKLEYESDYQPKSWRARSALYVWYRYARTLSISRHLGSRALQIGADSPSHPTPAEEGSEEEFRQFESCVRVGAAQWLRYSRMVDGVAATRQVPVVHAIQPFQYANGATAVSPAYVGKTHWSRLFLQARHPSQWYSIIRKTGAGGYAGLPASGKVWFADLSESVPPDEVNWLDYIHPSEQGARILGEQIGKHLLDAGCLQGKPPARPGVLTPDSAVQGME